MTRRGNSQAELPLRYLDKNGQLRGGARPGAGRPKRQRHASEAHRARPELTGREAILVTARVVPAVGNMRRWRVYHAVRKALATALARTDFRVVHASIQRTHLHLVVEAASQQALSSGMQGLLISAAKHINRARRRELRREVRGGVFPDRYHERVITSPKQCRHATAYVLNNWRRHGEDRGRSWVVDPFSSAVNFGGWRELAGSNALFETPGWYERLPTSSSETWLLRVGWSLHGRIAARHVPGPAQH